MFSFIFIFVFLTFLLIDFLYFTVLTIFIMDISYLGFKVIHLNTYWNVFLSKCIRNYVFKKNIICFLIIIEANGISTILVNNYEMLLRP